MKILLVNKFHYYKGGAETFYLGLGKELEKQGYEVAYFSMKSDKNLPCIYSKYFVKNREYNEKVNFIKKTSAFVNFSYSFEAKKNFKFLVKEFKPDLIILNNIHRQITTSILDNIQKYKIPTFWVIHDLILLCPCYTMLNSHGEICDLCANGKYFNCYKLKCVKNSKVKSLLAVIEAIFNKKRNIIDKIDFLIAPSKFYRDIFIKHGIKENKIQLLPNPYFPLDFSNKSTKYEYFLYFGRLSREKGIIKLINCFTKSQAKKLVICGDGPLRNEIVEIVAKYNMRIQYVGFKSGDDLFNIINNAKCCIIPSEWYENSPYSGLEAMYFKKPLIVSSYGGLPELISGNGFVFHDDDELISQIDFIESLSINELLKYGENSFKLLNKEHDLNSYVKGLLSLFKKSLDVRSTK